MKISSKEEAEQFLKETLRLRIDETVVREIGAVHRGESNRTSYDLYAKGKYRDDRERNSICGNGTVRKLRKFFVEGKLNPYVSARYSLKEAPLALAALLERKVTGKVVIEPR